MKGIENHHLRVVAAATGRLVGWRCVCLVSFIRLGVLETLMGPTKPNGPKENPNGLNDILVGLIGPIKP